METVQFTGNARVRLGIDHPISAPITRGGIPGVLVEADAVSLVVVGMTPAMLPPGLRVIPAGEVVKNSVQSYFGILQQAAALGHPIQGLRGRSVQPEKLSVLSS